MNEVKHIPSQNERILDYMRTHGGITQMEAIKSIGVMRLASRISDLRRRGYIINDRFKTVTNRYGEKCNVKVYWLEGDAAA